GLAGDAIDRVVECEPHALVRGVHPDEDGDAEDNPRGCEHSTENMLAKVRPADQPQQNHPGTQLRAAPCRGSREISCTIRPSRSAIVRAQLSATCMSWVTITMVEPRRVCRSRISARMSSPVCVSRFPVGSSARRIGG